MCRLICHRVKYFAYIGNYINLQVILLSIRSVRAETVILSNGIFTSIS